MRQQKILVLVAIPLTLSILAMTPGSIFRGPPNNAPRFSLTLADATTADSNDAMMKEIRVEARSALNALQLKRSQR